MVSIETVGEIFGSSRLTTGTHEKCEEPVGPFSPHFPFLLINARMPVSDQLPHLCRDATKFFDLHTVNHPAQTYLYALNDLTYTASIMKLISRKNKEIYFTIYGGI
jgi:hypothetical protein